MSGDAWANPLFATADKGGRRSWGELLRMMAAGELVVPPYQRPHVWTVDQQARWVGYVLSQAPCPAIFLREVNTADAETFRDEIVDGQQRLTACLGWLRGEFAAVIPWSGEEAWCRTERDALRLRRLGVAVVSLPPDTTDRQAIEMYLTLNTEGTPHTAEELAATRRLLDPEGLLWEPIWGDEIVAARRAGTDDALAWLDGDGWKVFALADGGTGPVLDSGPEQGREAALLVEAAMKKHGTWKYRVADSGEADGHP